MVAVRQKPAAALVFKRGGRAVVPQLPPLPVDIPPPPEEVGDYGRAVWAGFWTTPVAGLVDMRRDGERLRHWCRCVDARAKLWKMFLASPLAEGVQGQPVTSPYFTEVMRLSMEIERAETTFGMNPLSKMRLTGALDQAEQAESNIKRRREGRRPTVVK